MARSPRPGIERDLHALANPKRAIDLQRFFKTGPGGYGEGDRFLGLTMPQVRQLARTHGAASLKDIERLLESPWHEARTLALVLMVNQYAQASEPARRAIYRLYLARTDRINNWDLVDVSAPGVVGAHLLMRQRGVLRRLARSRNLWERRIAMVSTAAFIRNDQFDDTLALADMLLTDPHDLMHKAVGWMLREVGKRDEKMLRRFLDRHAARMPRTALRYALERLTPRQRQHYMTTPRT
ncbi:MAG: DNA alkylation repair protein [Vicinamibacterales bacterium]